MSAAQHQPGPLLCLIVQHDLDCPGAQGDALHCRCIPDFRFVSRAEFIATVARDNKQRKAAKQGGRK